MRIKITPKLILSIFVSLALIILLLFWQKTYSSELGIVKKVVDGDTIELESGETVRYIGVDTPETSPPLTPIECYGPEATQYNKSLIEGKEIILKRDIKNKDKFGRILRYVYIDDKFINLELVKEGYARNLKVLPNVSFSKQFEIAEKNAKENNRGLWSENLCNGEK